MRTTPSATVVSVFVVSPFIVRCSAPAAAAQGSCDFWKLAERVSYGGDLRAITHKIGLTYNAFIV